MKDQINRIEKKLDVLLIQTNTNKLNVDHHISFDKWYYKGVVGLFIFVFTMHSLQAVEFIKGLI